MLRRRRAEGSIYTGKRQDTKWWPSLPHHTIRSKSITEDPYKELQ
jgi:hypothetical protein